MSAFDLLADSIDHRYGKMYQCHRQLKDLGWLNREGDNALCGPTCVANVLLKFKRSLDLKIPDSSIKLIHKIATEILPHRDFQDGGSEETDLAEAMQKYLMPFNIDLDFSLRHQFNLKDLSQSTKDDRAVIVLVRWWKPESFSAEKIPNEDYVEGHYLIVGGVEGEVVTFFDPYSSRYLVRARVESETNDNGRKYYRLHWLDKSPSVPSESPSFITSVLEIRILADQLK